MPAEGVERWVPSWWAVVVLVRAGAQPDHARAAVADVIDTAGRWLRPPRGGVLPGWALRDLLAELRTWLDGGAVGDG